MSKLRRLIAVSCGISLIGSAAALADGIEAARRPHHVLLVSIDGMHALDLHNCASANTCPNLASLTKTGVNYTRTAASKPSDSFPGMMAIATGGTPKFVGVYYDVAYDRVLAPPTIDTGNGLLHGDCTVGQANGTRTEYEEGVGPICQL